MIDVINLENEIDMDINNIYSKNNKVTKENVNKICPKCMDYCKCIDDIQYDINRKIKLSKEIIYRHFGFYPAAPRKSVAGQATRTPMHISKTTNNTQYQN